MGESLPGAWSGYCALTMLKLFLCGGQDILFKFNENKNSAIQTCWDARSKSVSAGQYQRVGGVCVWGGGQIRPLDGSLTKRQNSLRFSCNNPTFFNRQISGKKFQISTGPRSLEKQERKSQFLAAYLSIHFKSQPKKSPNSNMIGSGETVSKIV